MEPTRVIVAATAALAVLAQMACIPSDPAVEFVPPAEGTYVVGTAVLVRGDTTATVGTARVTEQFFGSNLPGLGRTFLAADFAIDAEPVVVLGERLWMEQFGGTPEIIGTEVQLDGRDHRVLGVMPPGFVWPAEADLWVAAIDQVP